MMLQSVKQIFTFFRFCLRSYKVSLQFKKTIVGLTNSRRWSLDCMAGCFQRHVAMQTLSQRRSFNSKAVPQDTH